MGVLIWLLMVTMGGVTFAKPPHLFLVVADDLVGEAAEFIPPPRLVRF